MDGKRRSDIGRAMSMADAAPMLSTTPRGSQLGSAFQDGDGAFDASYSKVTGAAGTAAGGGSRGGSSSTSRKPGRCVWFGVVKTTSEYRIVLVMFLLTPTIQGSISSGHARGDEIRGVDGRPESR